MSSCTFAETMKLNIEGSQGKLAAVIQKPELKDGEKCMMVMILHGLSGNKNEKLLTTLADLLEAKNIASIRFDFNGHGESEGDFVNMTMLNEIEDARKVYEYVKGLDYVEGISIAGHSQGGVVTSMLAGELGSDNVKKIVLFAPAAVIRDDALRGNFFGVAFDALNPPEYVSLAGVINIGRNYILTAQTLPIFETAEKFTGPAFMIHGKADTTVPYTYSMFYKRVYADGRLHLIEKADHIFTGFVEEAASIALKFLTEE